MIDTADEPFFRRATQADVPAIVALVESVYLGDSSRRGWTTEADLLDGQRVDAEGVSEALAQPGSRIVLALRGEELLACVQLSAQEESCHFGMFAVRPDAQGGGVGKRVMAEAERIARGLGLARMRMSVIDLRAELIAFYERRGYLRTGIKLPFPGDDPRFGLPRRDDLRFEVLEKAL